jgi:CDP-diacylglycerol--glycerol-3-phosphate 3-phosphatidyltransferase
MKVNLPNIITISRAVLAPIFMALLLAGGRVATVLAVLVFIIAAITDYLDGWFARKYGQSSAWGTLIDPLADKILTTAAFSAFALLGLVEWWMVFFVVIRDVGTTVFRSYADNIGKPLVTSWSAKVKTFVQMTFIIVVLVFLAVLQLPLPSWMHLLASWVLTVITVWTGIEYFVANRAILRPLCLKFFRLTRPKLKVVRRFFKRSTRLE